jgi:hypothetical protein
MGEGMAKPFVIGATCAICAAVAAGIYYYSGATIDQGGPQLERAASPKAAVAATADTNVEVLGDRVRCDVRYQELKIPPTEYQAFNRKCMGDKWDGD